MARLGARLVGRDVFLDRLARTRARALRLFVHDGGDPIGTARRSSADDAAGRQ
jgi:hypothetical protein